MKIYNESRSKKGVKSCFFEIVSFFGTVLCQGLFQLQLQEVQEVVECFNIKYHLYCHHEYCKVENNSLVISFWQQRYQRWKIDIARWLLRQVFEVLNDNCGKYLMSIIHLHIDQRYYVANLVIDNINGYYCSTILG